MKRNRRLRWKLLLVTSLQCGGSHCLQLHVKPRLCLRCITYTSDSGASRHHPRHLLTPPPHLPPPDARSELQFSHRWEKTKFFQLFQSCRTKVSEVFFVHTSPGTLVDPLSCIFFFLFWFTAHTRIDTLSNLPACAGSRAAARSSTQHLWNPARSRVEHLDKDFIEAIFLEVWD